MQAPSLQRCTCFARRRFENARDQFTDARDQILIHPCWHTCRTCLTAIWRLGLRALLVARNKI